MTPIRIALVQLECHPAVSASHISFLDEPFVPKSNAQTLSALKYLAPQIPAVLTACRDQYLKWHVERVKQVLAFLSKLDPTPDLVFFPECSLPPDALPAVRDFCVETGSVTFAGTHSPSKGRHARRFYEKAGIRPEDIEKAVDKHASLNVLPVIGSTESSIFSKSLLSPFERSDVSERDSRLPRLLPVKLRFGDSELGVAPLICAEALQPHVIGEPFSISAVLSYESKPKRFGAFVEQEISNKHQVIYCNDGRFGGSSIFTVEDARAPSWFRTNFQGGLPPGDVLLVAEVDADAVAVEVGTATPAEPFKLVCLADIVSEQDGAREFSDRMSSIVAAKSSDEKAAGLGELALQDGLSELQRRRAVFLADLERQGIATTNWWEALGLDCVLKGIPSLRILESDLANIAAAALAEAIGSGSVNAPTDITSLAAFMQVAKKRVVTPNATAERSRAQDDIQAIEDRDAETARVHQFLDNPSLRLLEVTGLPQIGKSSAIGKALAHSGIKNILRLRLNASSTPEYLISSVLGRDPTDAEENLKLPLSPPLRKELSDRLALFRIAAIEGAHHMQDHGIWRDPRFNDLLIEIFDIGAEKGTKFVLETNWRLPLELRTPAERFNLKIHGLDRDRLRFGVSLLNANLRRWEAAPSSYPEQKKEEFVRKLGGHPVALALAADILFEDGVSGLEQAIKNRKGSLFHFVEGLVRSVALTDVERQILEVCTLARGPVDRSAILGTVDSDSSDPLRSLIASGAIDVRGDEQVEIAGVLRDYFDGRDVPESTRLRFHHLAAKTFQSRVAGGPDGLAAAVESDYHAALAGEHRQPSTNLVDANLGAARELFRQQRYAEAAELIRIVIQTNKSVDALGLAAEIEARNNNFPTAIRYAKEVFEKNPSDRELLVELARISFTQYQDEALAELLDVARRAHMETDSLLVIQGRLEMRRHNPRGARDLFERAARISERNPWPYFYLGKVRYQLGDVKGALQALEEGEEFIYGRDLRARNVLGAIRTQMATIFVMNDRLAEAKPLIESLMEQDTDNPEVVRIYAAYTIKAEGVTEAHKAMERLAKPRIRNRFERSQFHLLYAMFYEGIGDAGRANEEFRKANQADEGNVYVMIKWADNLFLSASEQYYDAESSYQVPLDSCAKLVRRILGFDSDNADALRLMNALRQRFQKEV